MSDSKHAGVKHARAVVNPPLPASKRSRTNFRKWQPRRPNGLLTLLKAAEATEAKAPAPVAVAKAPVPAAAAAAVAAPKAPAAAAAATASMVDGDILGMIRPPEVLEKIPLYDWNNTELDVWYQALMSVPEGARRIPHRPMPKVYCATIEYPYACGTIDCPAPDGVTWRDDMYFVEPNETVEIQRDINNRLHKRKLLAKDLFVSLRDEYRSSQHQPDKKEPLPFSLVFADGRINKYFKSVADIKCDISRVEGRKFFKTMFKDLYELNDGSICETPWISARKISEKLGGKGEYTVDNILKNFSWAAAKQELRLVL